MNENDCQCPPKPCYTLGSFASGSTHEEASQRRWEEEHGRHSNAGLARLEPVWLDSKTLGGHVTSLRMHLETKGPHALMEIAPHVLKALIDAAALADAVPVRVQKELDGALAALRRIDITDGESPQDTVQAVCEARDRLREAGAKDAS